MKFLKLTPYAIVTLAILVACVSKEPTPPPVPQVTMKLVPITDLRQREDVMAVYKNGWLHGYQAAAYAKQLDGAWWADSTAFERKFFGK